MKCHKFNPVPPMPQLTSQSADLMFVCPGCNEIHGINTNTWTWNGDCENPTIMPSILVLGDKRCHSFVINGRISFLDDCFHELKGKTVDLPEWDERYS